MAPNDRATVGAGYNRGLDEGVERVGYLRSIACRQRERDVGGRWIRRPACLIGKALDADGEHGHSQRAGHRLRAQQHQQQHGAGARQGHHQAADGVQHEAQQQRRAYACADRAAYLFQHGLITVSTGVYFVPLAG